MAMWAFTGSKKLMEHFKDIVYNTFISMFKKHTRMYPIKPNDTTDLQEFMKVCLIDKEAQKLATTLREKYSKEWLDDYDLVVVDTLREVKRLLTYMSDVSIWAVPEYWQVPSETINKKTGDCEDGAILIVTLARINGIPAKRIFLSCGNVDYNKKKVGHAYVTYLGNDGAEYILDWCYFYDGRRIPTRKRNWYDDRYFMPRWFFGNDGGFYK